MFQEYNTILLLLFHTTFIALISFEQIPNLQRKNLSTSNRWVANIGLLLINGVFLRSVLPITVLAFALAQSPGLMSKVGLPIILQIIIGFLLLDFLNYWTHFFSHKIPFLWRAHLVHHSDTDIDVTTSQRHHPFEALFGSMLSFIWIFFLGIPAEAFAVYTLVATFVTVFSHANISLSDRLDRWLRFFIVTPNFHGIHHSAVRVQTDSNFSVVLTVWDRLFGTYTNPNQSTVIHYGLEYFHSPKHTSLFNVLIQPIVYKVGMPYQERDKCMQIDKTIFGHGKRKS